MSKRKIASVGTNVTVYKDTEYGEYIVERRRGSVINTYHTDNKADALGTAQAMAGAKSNPKSARRQNPVGSKRIGKGYGDAALWTGEESLKEQAAASGFAYDDLDVVPLVEHAHAAAERFASLAEKAGVDLGKYESTQLGHDLWLTRNGHGAGFWDGDYSEPDATVLTKISKQMGERDVYVGDDGAVHVSPSRA